MDLPIRVIDGKDLMERWGMSTFECLCLTFNHDIDPVGKFVGIWEWERIGWDIVIEDARESKNKINFSEQVFFLSDITEFEEKHDSKFDEDNRKVITVEQLTQRWGLVELEVMDILDNCAAVTVDSLGFPLKEKVFSFLLLEQEISTGDLLYSLNDIERIEEEYPELKDRERTPQDRKINSSELFGGFEPESPHANDETSIPVVSFYKNGQIWKIGEKGKEKDFNDLLGFHFIRFLLRYEGEIFDPAKVYFCGNVPDEIRSDLHKMSFQTHLDPYAIQTIANHKRAMEKQLLETSDEQIIRELEYDIERCEAILRNAKKGFAKYKNLRSNVRKRIKTAIEAIERQSREFSSLKPLLKYLCLDNPIKTIKTGISIWYRHDPSDPVSWLLDPPNP
jgi:hypothetical protein